MRIRFLIFGVLLVPGFVELAIAPTATRRADAGMSALVPAYFYPGTGGTSGVGDGWAQFADAASTIGITAIFNPNERCRPGPRSEPRLCQGDHEP